MAYKYLEKTYREYIESCGSIRKAAKECGSSYGTFYRGFKKGPDDKVEIKIEDPLLLKARGLQGSDITPSVVWYRGKDDEGNKFTALYRKGKDEEEQESIIDGISCG